MSSETSHSELKIELFGIGLDTYWSKFEKLPDRLCGYIGSDAQRLERSGVRVVNLGLIDPEKTFAAGHEFRREDVDLVCTCVTTYALSSIVLSVVGRAKNPVIILNLSPANATDCESFHGLGDRTKMTGEWLAHCQSCLVLEIANAFNRSKIPFFQVTGRLQEGSGRGVEWGRNRARMRPDDSPRRDQLLRCKY